MAPGCDKKGVDSDCAMASSSILDCSGKGSCG